MTHLEIFRTLEFRNEEHSQVEREGNPAKLCPRVDREGRAEKGREGGKRCGGGSSDGGRNNACRHGGRAPDAAPVAAGGDDADVGRADRRGRSEQRGLREQKSVGERQQQQQQQQQSAEDLAE